MIYLLFFAILIMCHVLSHLSFFEKRNHLKNILAIWLPVICLILISTFKSNNVGTDTGSYFSSYKEALKSDDPYSLQQFQSYEIGFRYLFLTFAKYKIPFKIFQLFVYVFIYTLLGVVVRKESKYPCFSLLVFSLWSFMIFNFSGLRQAMADSLAFFSFFVLTRRFKKTLHTIICVVLSLVLFAISCTLHTSSIAFAIAFLLYGVFVLLPNSFHRIIVIMAIFVPFIFFLTPQLYELFFYILKINYYIPTERAGVGELFYLYYAILLFAMVFSTNNIVSIYVNNWFDKIKFFRQKENLNTRDESISNYTLVLISAFLIGSIIQSFSAVCFTMTRLSNPFLLSVIIIVPNIIYRNKSKNLRIAAQFVFIVVLALVFLVDYYKGNYLNGFPYSFSF